MNATNIVALCVMCSLSLALACTPPNAEDEPTPESNPAASTQATKEAETPTSTQPQVVTTAQLQALISERHDRPLVVHFWASWCGPCVKEWPTLQTLAATWADKADFVMVSVDDAIDNPQMLGFLREHPARAASHWWGDDDMDGLLKTFGAGWQGSLPATFVFDATGEQRRAWLEPIPSARLEKLLESLSASIDTRTPGSRLARFSPTTRPQRDRQHRSNRCGTPSAGEPSPPPTVTTRSLQDRIARLRDQVLVVHVWASWCSVCHQEWPEFEAFVESVRGCSAQVVGIATDEDGDALAQWLSGAQPRFANLWLASDRASMYQFLQEDWEGEIPATFVFDATGKRVFAHVGLLDAASLLEVVGTHQESCVEGAQTPP